MRPTVSGEWVRSEWWNAFSRFNSFNPQSFHFVWLNNPNSSSQQPWLSIVWHVEPMQIIHLQTRSYVKRPIFWHFVIQQDPRFRTLLRNRCIISSPKGEKYWILLFSLPFLFSCSPEFRDLPKFPRNRETKYSSSYASTTLIHTLMCTVHVSCMNMDICMSLAHEWNI